jgi:hypothetical protein
MPLTAQSTWLYIAPHVPSLRNQFQDWPHVLYKPVLASVHSLYLHLVTPLMCQWTARQRDSTSTLTNQSLG